MSTYETMKSALNFAGTHDGSFALDNIAAVAVELDRLEQLGINYMPNRFFPSLAWGDDLTASAANFGVYRNDASASHVTLTVTGDVGAVINGDVKAVAGDLVFACTQNTVIGDSGSIDVEAVCETMGIAGNVASASISKFITTYAGLVSVTNNNPAHGGVDIESDESLLSRIKIRWQNPSTGGNVYDYIRWSTGIDGVSRAYVTNPSAGNVNVYVVGDSNTSPTEELLQNVYDYLQSVRPIGATVTVLAAEPLVIDIDVNVELADGYLLADVTEAIKLSLSSYINGLDFEHTKVSYLKLADLLFVEGIKDVLSYTVNAGSESIIIPQGEFPTLGEVSVHGN